MRKERTSATKPLRGVRVLVGRARHQAGALAAELRKLGAQVIQIPFIEIRKPQSFQPLDSALKNLSRYDWLILTSVNGVKAMWERMKRLNLARMSRDWEGPEFPRALKNAHPRAALAAGVERIRVVAIGPATKKAIEQRGVHVDVVPKEYVAESVVQSLKGKVEGKRVLLVRAKVARDVIPRELRRAGARVDVVEAYETVVPRSSRARLRAALSNSKKRPHVVTFTSSSTVRNFVESLGGSPQTGGKTRSHGRACPERSRRVARADTTSLRGRESPRHTLDGILMASIGPVTSSTLRELGLPVDIEAKEFTIPGLIDAMVRTFAERR